MHISTFEETHIEGTVKAGAGQILYTSIPYDEGWHILIDGERVPRENYLRIGDALLGLRIDEGEHEIVMDYEPIGLSFGACVSVCTLIALALGLLIARRRRRKADALPETPVVESVEAIPVRFDARTKLEPIDDPHPDGFFLSDVEDVPQGPEGTLR